MIQTKFNRFPRISLSSYSSTISLHVRTPPLLAIALQPVISISDSIIVRITTLCNTYSHHPLSQAFTSLTHTELCIMILTCGRIKVKEEPKIRNTAATPSRKMLTESGLGKTFFNRELPEESF
jgi:hypothetical protein